VFWILVLVLCLSIVCFYCKRRRPQNTTRDFGDASVITTERKDIHEEDQQEEGDGQRQQHVHQKVFTKMLPSTSFGEQYSKY